MPWTSYFRFFHVGDKFPADFNKAFVLSCFLAVVVLVLFVACGQSSLRYGQRQQTLAEKYICVSVSLCQSTCSGNNTDLQMLEIVDSLRKHRDQVLKEQRYTSCVSKWIMNQCML